MQAKLVGISALITVEQREWLDAEVLRRSEPGAMESISGVIRLLIDTYRTEREQASGERASMVAEQLGEKSQS